jgi:hypothetical protein
MKFAVLWDVRQCNAYRLQNFLLPSFFFHGSTAPVGLDLLTVEVSLSLSLCLTHTHTHTHHSVGLLWTSDWADAGTST